MKRLLDRLLGRDRASPDATADDGGTPQGRDGVATGRRDIAAIAATLVRPALHVVRAEGFTRSHFGGTPDLPPDVAWPEHGGRPLSFLARLSLPEMQAALPIDWLPAEGALLFFYDLETQPWGWDPSHRGAAAVLHVPEPHDVESTAPAPLDGAGELQTLPRRALAFRRIDVLPSWTHPEVTALGLDGEEFDEWLARSTAPFGGAPAHQVAGHPSPVQGDVMALECQLASHGVSFADEGWQRDRRVPKLRAGADDWRLLFQFDSDEDLDVQWGDDGCIYFWVPQSESRRGDFSNAWLVLQCH